MSFFFRIFVVRRHLLGAIPVRLLAPIFLVGSCCWFSGCFSSVALTDFQEGRTLASDSASASFGITLAHWWKPSIDSSSGTYEVSADRRTLVPVVFFQYRYPLYTFLDVGGEATTTLGALNFKCFAKFAMPPLVPGISAAALPSIGFGGTIFPDTLFGILRVDRGFTSYSFTSALAFPVTFEVAEDIGMTLTPSVFYQYHEIEYEAEGHRYDLHNNQVNLTSHAFSAMLRIHQQYVQATFVNVRNDQWFVLVGIKFGR